MKPSKLYKRKPEKIDMDINHLNGFYYNHVPEISELDCGVYIEDGKNTRVFIHYYKDYCFDGRRTWTLAAVKLDDTFVMITQNAGREGDDHAIKFVTNSSKYIEMIAYIRTLLPNDEPEVVVSSVSPNDDIKELVDFYGNKLDGDFKPY